MPSPNLPGLTLDLTLDSISGDGQVLDESGKGNHGVVSGPVTVVDDAVFGTCLDFPGGAGCVSVNDPFSNDETFTISLWVRPAVLDDGGFHGIIGKQGDAARKPSLWVSPAKGGLHYDSYEAALAERKVGFLEDFFTARAGEWVHVCWVKDGTTYRFYRDGVEFASAPAPKRFYRADSTYHVGGVDNFFRGRMARLRILDRPIEADELAQVLADDLGKGSPVQTVTMAPAVQKDIRMKSRRQKADPVADIESGAAMGSPEIGDMSDTPETNQDAAPMTSDQSDYANGLAGAMRAAVDAATTGKSSVTDSELSAFAYRACYALSFGAVKGLLDGVRAAAGGRADEPEADTAPPPTRAPTQVLASEDEPVVVNRSLRDSRR